MKALIAGAGIAGLAAAFELGRKGWDVVLVEKANGLRDSGYMIDFFGPGYDAAEENGLIGALAERAYKIEGVELVNADGRRQAYTRYETFRASLDGRLFSLMRGDIELVFHNALPTTVDLRLGTHIETIHEQVATVDATLSDGERITADLLIGADGIHSDLRERLFGPEGDTLRYLGFQTAAYIFNLEEVKQIARDNYVMVSVVDRQISFYTMHDGRQTVYFIWRDAEAERAEDIKAKIAQKFGDMDWLVPDVIAAAPKSEEIYYDIVAQIERKNWHKGRAVLLGDAAYAVSLLAGQGASLAIGGAYVLARELEHHADVAAALRAYEAVVRPSVEKKQAAGRRTADWFVPSSAFRVWLRATVFNLSSLPLVPRIITSFVASSPKGVFFGEGR